MSLSAVRLHFQTQAATMGFRKHYDGFATDNIPGSKFDKSFHVESFNFSGSPQAMNTVDISVPVTVRFYFKAFQDVDAAIAKASDAGEAYIEKILSSELRLGNSNFKNVVFESMAIEPYAASNDNYVVCRIEFSAQIYKAIC